MQKVGFSPTLRKVKTRGVSRSQSRSSNMAFKSLRLN